MSNQKIAVFGASGHTGRFVVAELKRRGIAGILVGRHREKLARLQDQYSVPEFRVADVHDARSLDRALADSALVVNCAGPFLNTAAPVIEAALRAGIHYIDVSAEQKVTLAAFNSFCNAAREAGVLIIPSMGFFGGLGDLLATAAMGDWKDADEICLAVALDSWKPTRGTRMTGERNPGRRSVFSKGRLEPLADPPTRRHWDFAKDFGVQEVVAFPLTETIVVSQHLRTPEIHAFLNSSALADLHDPNTPGPTAVDENGPSDQRFRMDVVAGRGEKERSATVVGRDIYAITAPLVVEAAQNILNGNTSSAGTVAPGEIFDAGAFLSALSPEHFSFILNTNYKRSHKCLSSS